MLPAADPRHVLPIEVAAGRVVGKLGSHRPEHRNTVVGRHYRLPVVYGISCAFNRVNRRNTSTDSSSKSQGTR